MGCTHLFSRFLMNATPSLLGALALALPTAFPAARAQDAKRGRRVLTNSIDAKLVLIPAGEFLMGSPPRDDQAEVDEKLQHRVRITRPFYLGVSEVTRRQFRVFVNETGYQTEAERDGKGAGAGARRRATWSRIPGTRGRVPDSSRPTSTRWST
jgi:formylglycine-generating enzyme required for sulfatase activity